MVPTAGQCIVYLWLSSFFQQQICIVLTLFGVTALPTVANLTQQSTTIDTEREKESEEIGGGRIEGRAVPSNKVSQVSMSELINFQLQAVKRN